MLSALVLTACSAEKFEGDAPKDWDGNLMLFAPTEDASFSTYYMPEIGRVGDPMPFYDQKAGEFKVLYLQEFNNNDPYCYHPFYGVSTKDGANYQGLGEVLPTGRSKNEADAALGTGCAVYNEADGLYYIYYTGHTAKEVVMRATSPDFKSWTKDKAWVLRGAEYGYSETDFRDPQVFKTEDGKWHMVISSHLKFAEFVSDNMKDWKHVGEFPMIWDRMLECPDIFKMGDYWYFVYSEAFLSDWSRKVKYMMADSWENLKKRFKGGDGADWPNDGKEGVLDTRAFYAGKTASNGTDRYIWGWCPYRSGVTNDDKNINVGNGTKNENDGTVQKNEPEWSGALVCHKLIQHADGTLTIGKVPAMDAKYNKPAEVKIAEKGDDGKTYVAYNRLGAHNHISFTAKTANDGDRFGVSFCFGYVYVKEIDKNTGLEVDVPVHSKRYTLMVNPEGNDRRKVNFEQEGPFSLGFIPGADGYIFPRPTDNTYHVDIYTDNSVVTMYINGDYGCTQRIYGIQKNCWSINTYGNDVTVTDVKVSQY